MTTRDDLIERLAAVEHQRWSDWQRWVHDRGYRMVDDATIHGEHRGTPAFAEMPAGSLCIAYPVIFGWERQINSRYSQLSEREKQSAREQVARYWPLIVAFVSDWLIAVATMDCCTDLEAQWREEMGNG